MKAKTAITTISAIIVVGLVCLGAYLLGTQANTAPSASPRSNSSQTLSVENPKVLTVYFSRT